MPLLDELLQVPAAGVREEVVGQYELHRYTAEGLTQAACTLRELAELEQGGMVSAWLAAEHEHRIAMRSLNPDSISGRLERNGQVLSDPTDTGSAKQRRQLASTGKHLDRFTAELDVDDESRENPTPVLTTIEMEV
jgi:hypothetical protein